MTQATHTQARLTLVAALARNRVIGINNTLPWRLPADLKHFKELTLGHTVIMGRKTWESLPPNFRPLPGRLNIVITRDETYKAAGATVVHSLDEVLDAGADYAAADGGTAPTTLFVIGGAELYAAALPLADRLELTEIDSDFAGDTWFPPLDAKQWRESARETHRDETGLGYAFATYERA